MSITIERYAGSHRDLEWSFQLAEDSQPALDAYIDLGMVWVARASVTSWEMSNSSWGEELRTAGCRDGGVVGHLQAVPRADDSSCGIWEVTNTAVVEAHRGHGVGRALLGHAIDEARAAGVDRIVLATATADVGNLRFYQRCGFRMTRVVHDVFTPQAGYPPDLRIDGIPLRDQVWFEIVL